MLDALKRFFDKRLADAEPGHGEHEAAHAVELATAALLVEMQRADDGEDVAADDAEIRRLLARHFALDLLRVERLVELAHERADRSVSLHEFTRLVHAHFSVAQKATVVEMLWRVAYADGRVDPHEEALVRKVADLLYLPQAAFIQAKERAQRG
jgi:uncharacterized tellurite resistance protein B-like protein